MGENDKLCTMERNNVMAAIEVGDVKSREAAWRESFWNDGSTDFVGFMTRPSVEREAFLKGLERSVEFAGRIAAVRI